MNKKLLSSIIKDNVTVRGNYNSDNISKFKKEILGSGIGLQLVLAEMDYGDKKLPLSEFEEFKKKAYKVVEIFKENYLPLEILDYNNTQLIEITDLIIKNEISKNNLSKTIKYKFPINSYLEDVILNEHDTLKIIKDYYFFAKAGESLKKGITNLNNLFPQIFNSHT